MKRYDWTRDGWEGNELGDFVKFEDHEKALLEARADERERAAFSAGVRVKPLEWERPLGDDGTMTRADTIVGIYRVWTFHEANGRWFVSLCDSGGPIWRRYAADKAAAKAAAQADYESRIRSALAPEPEGDGWLAAEREAMGALLAFCRAATFALDDMSETLPNGDQLIDASAMPDVNAAFERLMALPDDQPGYTMGPMARVEWALRRLLPTPPISAESDAK